MGCCQSPGYDITVKSVDAGATICRGNRSSPNQRPHLVILKTPKLPSRDAAPITYKCHAPVSCATIGKTR